MKRILDTKRVPIRLVAVFVISLALLGAVVAVSAHHVRVKTKDPTLSINQQTTFEGITFNTTGTVSFNSTAITGGSLKLRISDGTVIVTTTFTINAEKHGSGTIIPLLMFAHVNDSSNIEVAAYLYIDVQNGNVNAYFADRNADFDQSGTIGFIDLSIMNAHYGKCSGQSGFLAATDLDANGCTDFLDLSIFNFVYGAPAYR